jgi:hypothetical protein
MSFNQKIQTFIAGLFVIALITVTIIRLTNEQSSGIELSNNYFDTIQTSNIQNIDANYPKLAVLKSIPYYTENNYFTYRINPSFVHNDEIDIFLIPKFTEQELLNEYYNATKQEILSWIISKGTVISDLKIDFYLESPDQSTKTLIEQINQ